MGIIQDIFTYPFRGSGKYMILFGSILSLVSEVVKFAPLFGVIASLILAAYLTATYFEIIETTATGSDEAPMFPNVTSVWDDLAWPMLKSVIVFVVSFAPVIVYLMAVDEADQNPGVLLALLGLSTVYFPMAMLGVVVLGYLGGMSPHIVFPAIIRAGGLYWLAVFLFALVYMGQVFLAGLLIGAPLIGAVLLSVVGIIAMMLNGRTLGIIYRERQEAMGWI
jgi:quinol-cytochrome oxidoreductase complex cytochrome b subunit